MSAGATFPTFPPPPSSASRPSCSTSRNGLSGPPKLPPEVVKTLEGYIQEMVKDPGVIAQLKTTGAWARWVSAPEELRNQVQATGVEMRKLWK